MPRQCGSCTMCCKVMGVTELSKPATQWCQHCDIGKGCNIYSERPPTCQEFECLWLFDEAWPEELRPDKSHVVMSSTLDQTRLIANVDPARPNAFQEGEMGELLNKIVQVMDVIVIIGDKRKALTTPDRKEAVMELIAARTA